MVTPIKFRSPKEEKEAPKKDEEKAPLIKHEFGSRKTWVYTWNNYTDADIEQLKLLEVNMHRCCKEIGENGTHHLQGAITFKRTYRLAALKKLFPKVHWEPAKSADPENYCIKGEIVIDIKKNEQGKRNDLSEAIAIATSQGIKKCAKEHPETFVKYYKGIKELLFTTHEDQEWFATEVIVLIGPPGCGKSKEARRIDPTLYNVPEPINGTVWFDGYTGQETILLDDFYGWLRYHTLLQITDGYPMKLPIKGGFVHRNWKRVIITSNKPPEEWYTRAEIDALKRRITLECDCDRSGVGNTNHPTSDSQCLLD